MSLCPRIFMSILSWRLVCGWWQQWCYDTSTYQPTDCGTTIHSTILPSKCLDFPMGGLGKKDQKHPTYIFSRIIEFPTSRYPPRNQQFASENGWLEDSFWDGFLAGAFLLVSGRFSATDCVLGTMIMGDYSMILGMGMFQHVCLQKKAWLATFHI